MPKRKWLKVWEKASDDLQDKAQKYLHHLKIKNYTARSLVTIRSSLSCFLSYAEERGIQRAQELTKDLLLAYRKYLKELVSERTGKSLDEGSAQKYMGGLSQWLEWLFANEYLLSNPGRNIRPGKAGRHLPASVLTHEEVETIINQADIQKPSGIRDRAMLEILYSCGLRASELASLSIEDVDLKAGTVFVREGKGRKDRLIPLGERAGQWTAKYIQEVRSVQIRGCQTGAINPLFLTARRHGFSAKKMSMHVKPYFKSAGIQKPGACHLFRHAMATHMLENGADIRYIQEMLGHANLSSTEIYTKVNIQALQKVHERTHPGAYEKEKMPEPFLKDKQNPDKYTTEDKRPKAEHQASFWQKIPAGESIASRMKEYLDWMETQGYSSSTVLTRSRYFVGFMRWCEARGITFPGELDKKAVENYQNYLFRQGHSRTQEPLSPRYRKMCLISMRQFLYWLEESGYVLKSSGSAIELPRQAHNIPRYILSVEQTMKVLSQPDVKTDMGVRDRAILETFYSTGMRCSELRMLRLRDVDSQRKTVYIRFGKGKRERVIPIGERALAWIDRYVEEVRPDYLKDDQESWLFVAQDGSALWSQSIEWSVRKYIKAADVGKKARVIF